MNYQVALSFSGEDRAFVRRIVERIKQLGVSVFYDQDEQANLWGQNLQEFFVDLFLHKAQFCLMIISESYKEKIWPNLERQAAFARAMKQQSIYLLPVRLDDTELPGLLPTISYIDGRVHTPEEIASLVLEILHREKGNIPGYRLRHPGSHPSENPVASSLFAEIVQYWPAKEPHYFDGSLQYDIDFLLEVYSEETPLAPRIPYQELANWISQINSRIQTPSIVRLLDGIFSFDDSNPQERELREAGFVARRGKNVGDQSEFVISLQHYSSDQNRYVLQRATYHDQVRSNLVMDFAKPGDRATLRSLLTELYGRRLPPWGSRRLADTVGAAVLMFFQHGNSYFPYLVPRAKSMPVFPGGWHCSASGAMKWPSSAEQASFNSCFMDDLYDEIREEIGLFRSAPEKRYYLQEHESYKEFRHLVANLDGEDIVSLFPVAFCREFLRGGKPQLFFLGYTPLTWAELTSRRIMASKVANKRGAREEIDNRLIHMMPDLGTVGELSYDKWSQRIHQTGYTLELLPLLYYASKVPVLSLIE